jgi:hypothetical protein
LIYIKVFDMYWGFENLVSDNELRWELRSQGWELHSQGNSSDGSNSSDVYVASDGTVKSEYELLRELRESKSKNKKFKVGEYTYPIFFLSFVCSTLLVGQIVQKIFWY